MKASEISLFSAKEQELLVSSEPKRLVDLDEAALGDLLARVRRARNKYVDLYRRQSTATIKATGKRSAAGQSNERTAQKAEILEDAVSRVARHLSRAARANATALKDERLAAASHASESRSKRAPTKRSKPAATKSGKKATESPIVQPARKGATSAANKRSQAGKDKRGKQ